MKYVITIIIVWFFYLTLSLIPTWLIASTTWLAIKASTGKCGIEYNAEVILASEWFCPAEVK